MDKLLQNTTQPKKPRAPAKTPEARENQLIAMTYDLVEKRILAGTASSQETTHFLKMGSQNAFLERKKVEMESKLLEARIKELQDQKKVEELYRQALNAMSRYNGQQDMIDDIID